MQSDENTARAVGIPSRSWASWSVWRGGPSSRLQPVAPALGHVVTVGGMSLGPGCEGDSASGMLPAPSSTGAVIQIIFNHCGGTSPTTRHLAAARPAVPGWPGCDRLSRHRSAIGMGLGPLSANSTVDNRGRARPGRAGAPGVLRKAGRGGPGRRRVREHGPAVTLFDSVDEPGGRLAGLAFGSEPRPSAWSGFPRSSPRRPGPSGGCRSRARCTALRPAEPADSGHPSGPGGPDHRLRAQRPSQPVPGGRRRAGVGHRAVGVGERLGPAPAAGRGGAPGRRGRDRGDDRRGQAEPRARRPADPAPSTGATTSGP